MGTDGGRGDDRLRVAWQQHKDRLWRALLAWSGDRDVASEALAEAFAQAARRGNAVDDVGRWVWRSAFRIAGELLAERRRHVVVAEVAARDAKETLPEDVVTLLDLLDRLPDTDRIVVVHAYVGGWTAGEIASLVGSTAGAVGVRLHRARRRLQQELEVHDA